ncbi:MAG: sensor histidine kinase [Propylenella sp.]
MLTLTLWLFVAVIFLPTIIIRHWGTGLGSMALDFSTYLISFAFAMAMFWVFRKTVDWPQTARVLILVATVFAVAVSNTLFDLAYTDWVAANVESSWSNLQRTLERGYPSALNYTLVFGVNMAFFQLSFARRRELRQERQLVDARSAAQQAQLAALRYQLNPHFLFNTLNSISALIVTRRNEDAEVMTDKLSTFLRTSLACDPAELVPLEYELSLLEEYLDIEAVRFGERLKVEIECPPEAGKALVPGFLVQPLVENAIKHGVAPSRDPVNIAVRAALDEGDLCITVANDHAGTSTPQVDGRIGVGLVNIERRLEAVYGKMASLTTERREDYYTATICIPEIQRAH